jgi:branched-subunit amino acid ABC-type transport system permease component
MDLQIALLLGQDGITNGAIYALLSLALVLVFTVTRVIFIPQGEFVAYGALTLASFQVGKTPGTLWLLVGAGIAVALVDITIAMRGGMSRRIPHIVGWNLVYPAVAAAIVFLMKPGEFPLLAQIALALALVVPLGPMIYRLAFQPLAEASVLVLLIVSVAVHWGIGRSWPYVLRRRGLAHTGFVRCQLELGLVKGQWPKRCGWWGASFMLIVVLAVFFGRTIYGKALRATAMNRTGARLMGISHDHGRQALVPSCSHDRCILGGVDRTDHHDLL